MPGGTRPLLLMEFKQMGTRYFLFMLDGINYIVAEGRMFGQPKNAVVIVGADFETNIRHDLPMRLGYTLGNHSKLINADNHRTMVLPVLVLDDANAPVMKITDRYFIGADGTPTITDTNDFDDLLVEWAHVELKEAQPTLLTPYMSKPCILEPGKQVWLQEDDITLVGTVFRFNAGHSEIGVRIEGYHATSRQCDLDLEQPNVSLEPPVGLPTYYKLNYDSPFVLVAGLTNHYTGVHYVEYYEHNSKTQTIYPADIFYNDDKHKLIGYRAHCRAALADINKVLVDIQFNGIGVAVTESGPHLTLTIND